MADIKQKYKTPNGDNIIDKDFADFKQSGGTINGDLETKGINMNGSLYIKDGIPINDINPSEYSRIVRSLADSDKGSFKIQLGTTESTFEVVNKQWNKSLLKVREGEVSVGPKVLADQGYCVMTGGLVIQWGKFNIPLTPNSSPSKEITFPISFPNTILVQNALCTNNVSQNGIDWTSAINCSVRTQDVHSAKVEVRDIATLPREFEFEINWFAIGY